MIDTTELSTQSGYPATTLRELARNGLLPAISDDGRWLFHADAVQLLADMASDAADLSAEVEDELEALYEDDEDGEDYDEDE